MVKKADTIMAITKGDGKKEVRFIALLVAFIWTTFTILGVVVLTTDSSIPMNVTFIRVCKGNNVTQNIVKDTLLPGLPPFIDDGHKKNMTRNNLLRIGQVFFVVIFVLTSQLRIRRYRQSHNLSYFMPYRQNIATIDQTIYYAYIKCFCNLMKSIQFIAVIQFNLILYMDVVGALIGNCPFSYY